MLEAKDIDDSYYDLMVFLIILSHINELTVQSALKVQHILTFKNDIRTFCFVLLFCSQSRSKLSSYCLRPEVKESKGLKVRRSEGQRVKEFEGLRVRESEGLRVPMVRGSESPRIRESEDQRVRESEGQRVKESEGQRVRE